jgi:hypothetical protein
MYLLLGSPTNHLPPVNHSIGVSVGVITFFATVPEVSDFYLLS